jgi:hypothetical protein
VIAARRWEGGHTRHYAQINGATVIFMGFIKGFKINFAFYLLAKFTARVVGVRDAAGETRTGEEKIVNSKNKTLTIIFIFPDA